jgi:hypothetical protein
MQARPTTAIMGARARRRLIIGSHRVCSFVCFDALAELKAGLSKLGARAERKS